MPVTSACRLFQAFQSTVRGALPRLLVRHPFGAGHARSANPDLNLKRLLMIGTAFPRKAILRRRLSAPLQEFLQCRLAVGIRDAFATLFQRQVEENPAQ